ncbi:MAG: hypothetical protein KGY61_01015 [Desulfobacterales bacterium]|nr:hypothetical protein [Desulfobacterales bacterium]
MGKKSLTKSTSKKKTTKKKSTAKTTSKKTVSTSSKTKQSTSKKTSAKKKPSLKTLRKKDFGTWAPETLYAPEPETEVFSAPPVIDTDDKKTAEKLRNLLDKQFEPVKKKKTTPKKTQKKKASPTTTAAKKKAAPKKPRKKAPSIKELIQKSFDTWKPEKPFVPAADKAAAGQFSAPPFAVDLDEDQLRELLSRQFDLSKLTPKPPAEPETKPAEETEETEEKAEVTEKPAEEKVTEPEKPIEPEAAAPEVEAAAPESEGPAVKAEPETEAEKPEPPSVAEPSEEPRPEAPSAEAESPEPEKKTAPESAETEEKPAAEPQKAEKKETKVKPKAEEKPPKAAKPTPKKETPKKPSPPPSGGGGQPPATPPPSGPQEPPPEPMSSGLKALIIGVAVLFACLILASALNSSKYYIKGTSKGTEVWKGNFSPRGKKMVVSLEGVEPPEDINGTVSKQKAYSLPFDYFMTRAERLSEKPGIPNFSEIRRELKKAKKYAVSQKQIQRVKNRLDQIDYTFLLYKADMASDQDTPNGYDKALEYLNEAKEYVASPSQAKRVERRIQEIRAARSAPEKPGAESKAKTGKSECPAEKKDAGSDSAKPSDKDGGPDKPKKSKTRSNKPEGK